MKRLVVRGSGMKKWIFLFAAVVAATVLSFAAFGDVSGDHHDETVESVLEDIRREQGVDVNAAIDPDRVSERNLERLGDAVMSLMHSDPRQHELMDRMMGGEGSESLASMHRMMGYRYLAGLAGGDSWGGMMGGFGMMGGYGRPGHGMMGGYGGGWWMQGHGHHEGFMPGRTGAGGSPGFLLGLRDELDLTDTQVRQLREYRDALIDSTAGLRGGLRREQARLNDLLQEEPVDLQQVERQVREIERIRADLRVAVIRAEVQAWDILTERQREELRSQAFRKGFGSFQGAGGKTGWGSRRGPGRRGTGRGMMGGGMMGY